MPKKTLIATPDLPFGDWLRASLVESGRFDAHLATDAAAALQIARALPAALALLDVNLAGLKAALEAEGVRVLMISDDGESGQADVISRPFTLADLFARLDAPTAETGGAPIWLDDPARVREDLNALLPAGQDGGARALAALILYEGGLWAWAGGLERPAAEEAAAALPASIRVASGVARFVRLSIEPSDYLLYAVGIQDGLALALLFPPATPLAQAARQTRALAQALPHRTAAMHAPLPAVDGLDEPYVGEDEALIEAMQKELAVLLAGMPPPDPTETPDAVTAAPETWQPEPGAPSEPPSAAAPATQPGEIPAWLLDVSPARPISDTAPVKFAEAAKFAPGRTLPEGHRDDAGRCEPVEANFTGAPASPASTGSSPASPASTGSAGSTGLGSAPASPASPVSTSSARMAGTLLTDVTYTYLLVAAAPGAVLTGELSAGLRLWLPQICQAFGWRLENFKVAPETLEWSLRLTPGMPLGQVVRAVRQRTSQKIFQQFPYLGNGQPGQDFWSPRYLVQRGTQPFGADAVRKFIVETRRAQGYIVSE